jgi:hypothetical protein
MHSWSLVLEEIAHTLAKSRASLPQHVSFYKNLPVVPAIIDAYGQKKAGGTTHRQILRRETAVSLPTTDCEADKAS